MNSTTTAPSVPRRKLARWWWGLALVIVAGGIYFGVRSGGHRDGATATFATRRGPLNITVLEGGSVQALDSQEIKCEVRVGYQGLKILKIVEEGYEVTEDDIKTNKVLVELDSSDLQKQITQQDIQYESAAASLTDAQQNYEIQVNQNLSDLEAAAQKVRFARMDFDKFLGDGVTQEIIDRLGLEAELAEQETNSQARVDAAAATAPGAPGAAAPVPPGLTPTPTPAPDGPKLVLPPIDASAPATTAIPKTTTNTPTKMIVASISVPPASALMPNAPGGPLPPGMPGSPAGPPPATIPNEAPPEAPSREPIKVDFSPYARIDALGDGEAKQKLRKFEDDFQVSRKEQGQAQVSLEGTRRLFEKGFVTRMDLEKEEIASDNSRLKVQTAETARDLFLKYEFVRTAEETLSKHAEATRALVRARKAAVSKMAQAQARLKSAQGQFNIQSRQRKELYEQLTKCTITPKRPGLVVYGGGRDDMFFYGGEERIREGATVRERQAIITIPDMTRMAVRVKIHESYIKKIKKGEKARITVDAFPDKVLDGEVTQVGVLPDSQNRWMNPDMKVYLTTITIDGTQDWLKPGMSAKVEVFVNRLTDVIYVPVQAVSAAEQKQVCYVANGGKPERRVVQVGEFNDEFIEIKSGLKEGERVILRPAETQEKPEEKSDKQPAAPAAPTPAPAPANTASVTPKNKA